jgi:rhamnosyltransferase
LLARIAPQAGWIVVVDNGSSGARRDATERLSKTYGNVQFVSLNSNLGLAAGHNVGIRIALERDAGFVLLLDQDSLPAPDMVTNLRSAYDVLVGTGARISAVGPRYRNNLTGHDSFFVQFGTLRFRKVYCSSDGTNLIPADFLISSGSLIPREAIHDVGEMREDLFIDHVDTEWFLRAAQCARRAYGVCNAVMEHGLGESALRIGLLGGREIPMHSPLRHYYTFRNSVFLYTRTKYPWRWKICDAKRLAAMLVVFSLLAPGGLAHLRMMQKGLWDGLIGRMGRYGSAQSSRAAEPSL